MKSRPILFSASMVQAILNGTKDRTRRLTGLDNINKDPNAWEFVQMFTDDEDGRYYAGFKLIDSKDTWMKVLAPYGPPGDQLWVRENWARNTGKLACCKEFIQYQADGAPLIWDKRWHPSIHMFKWMSRITLEVKKVRADRLQSITVEDINKEGLNYYTAWSILEPIANKIKEKEHHWFYENDLDEDAWCYKCGKKRLKQLQKLHPKEEITFIGFHNSIEEDHQCFCKKCGAYLDNCYTTYACKNELEYFDQNGFDGTDPDHCYSLLKILHSCGWDCNKKLAPKIQRYCWQALWTIINGKESWESSPYVFVTEFERIN